ncbi:MAG: DUF748 domain-containing protein, partial [Pseudomonadota bacterium]
MAGKPLNPWQKRGVIAVLLIALYALAGFLLAPWLVERTLVSTLKERLALDAELETLSINPFVLSLTVDELVVKEADGSTLFAFDRLYVNFQLSSLFRWAASFQEIHLIEPVLGAIRYEEARTNFHDLADRWTATGNAVGTAAAPEPEAADETTAAANPPAEATNLPRLLIADLRIVRGSIELTDEVPSETFSTVFAPIDLEVTDLSTLPDRQGNQQVVIRTESGAEVAWTGTLTVNPIALAGELRVAGSYTPLLFRYFRDQLALPVSFDGGDLAANLDYRFAVDRSGALSVIIENLDGTLAGLAVNQPDFPHLVEVEAFKVSGGSLRWPERTVHFDDIHFERVAVDAYRRDSGGYFPPVENEAVPPPTTDEALAEVTEDAAPWTLSADALRLTDWTLSHTDTTIPDSSLRVSEFDLSLEALSNADNATMPLKVLLRPALGGTVELEGSVQLLPTPALTAEVTGAGLLIATVQPYLSTFARVGLAGGTIAFQGSLASEAGTPYRYAGDLELRDLSLIDQVQEEALLSWTRLHVDRIEAEPSKVALSVLSLEAPYARIEIEQDGTTNLARTLVARDADTGAAPQVQSNDAGTSGATGDPVQPMTFSIGQTNIRDASARFTDLALPLPFEANISGLGGSASALSSKSSEPARIDLEGQVNEYGRLTINGALNPFAPRATTDVVVDFDNVDLPRMSPYTIKFAGRRIDEGRTDLTITVGLNEGRLDGNNRLVVRDLTLGEKVDQPGAMDLPLDLAVALLKDPSGELDFSFPVAGTLDDPSFSYGGAVRQAFSNVILGLATAPFRLLGSLVGLESADIEAIGFEPGRADLTPPQREILARLGEALDQRPQLVLELPGVLAPAEDRAALQAIAVDAEVARRLEAEDDGKTLLMEQQRRILESLFRETIQPAEAAEPTGLNLDTLTASHESVDAAGEAQFDEPAYLADLRDLLINAQEIPELEL